MKRLLNCTASDFEKMNKFDLIQSIQASEGRTLISEIVSSSVPLYPGLTNAEYASSFGADIILLNIFDVNQPHIEGLVNVKSNDVIRELKKLIGRPVGINLEPVDPEADQMEDLDVLPEGRRATKNTIEKAKDLGVDIICLTGNPKTGVSNKAILKSISVANEVAGDDLVIIAGKMHGAGVKADTSEGLADIDTIEKYVEAGADIILVPGVGTVPGATSEKTEKLIQAAHQVGALALTTIGTSQEGSAKETIQQMALFNKMVGADVHHIGDAGLHGIAVPENIMHYSIAIRGKRHTYTRMAASIRR
ncbi:haloacid dehalogenase-like hydrolase [Ornithinibacillus salinisoli]|uniref:Haloacid dehalogenase-like hydrolase n=1 Tax=Ornithinibacillus salinisoli TaxID=1848459 RepID=A0ABW4W0K2_9BACI